MLEPRAAGRAAPAAGVRVAFASRGIGLLVALAIVIVLPSCAPASPPAGAGPPNLVLLVLDTLRADHVGAYGGELPAGVSPELDVFAEQGVRFARVIAPSSWTRPSMGSLFTSRHPRTLGLYVEDVDLCVRGVWTEDDTIYFGDVIGTVIRRVSASGGPVETIGTFSVCSLAA